ncbi:MAG: right-handed parallel beta-helix repeat-containing protein [Prevotellaceae bacterium]|nr:right-handed parallel beta-helix repeat-containing protein [Prevotellaceae bacterium]
MAGDIYVSSVKGNDNGSGTADAPLKTLENALKMAREWRRLNKPEANGGINIMMREGTYRLGKPLFVRPEDSGTAASPTIIRGVEGEKVTISGGIEVKNWQKGCSDNRIPENLRGKIWVADAPMTGNRMVEIRQLWVNGGKARRATQFVEGKMQRMKAFNTDDESITIPTPAIDLTNANRLEMLVMQRWAIAILRVREMKNIGNGMTKVTFHQPESQLEFAHPWPQPVIDGEYGSSGFTLMNALELIDEPGEWYQDYPSGKIYYYPKDVVDMNSADVTAPVLETLVQIEGTRERQVSHIKFDNIGFEHSAWLRPSYEGHVTLQGGFRMIDAYKLKEPGLPHKAALENQAWIARPEAALTARFANNIMFDDCRFTHIGATALDFVYAVNSSEINGCSFTDIGGTAIMAGGFGEGGFETHIPYTPTIETDICSDIKISRCRIDDATNEDWGCAAISAGYVKNTDIVQNEVSNVNYSGICVGWGWTANESGMRNNRIVGNNVHDYAKQLYDAGGIYTLSNQPGSVISGNTVTLPTKAPYATNERAFCVYFDEATDGYTVEGNTFEKESYGYNQPGKSLIIGKNKYLK